MKTKKTILVVDDDEGTSAVLKLILEHAGYEVELDKNGDLESLAKGSFPDLILMDNKLGLKAGSEICAGLKSSDRTKHIPVMLISAAPNLAELAAVSCANDWLAKPFDIEPLLLKVETMLQLNLPS